MTQIQNKAQQTLIRISDVVAAINEMMLTMPAMPAPVRKEVRCE